MKIDLKQAIRDLQRRGFKTFNNGGHVRIEHPDGKKIFTCSGSPSCPHAHKNLLRDIRRYEKGIYK